MRESSKICLVDSVPSCLKKLLVFGQGVQGKSSACPIIAVAYLVFYFREENAQTMLKLMLSATVFSGDVFRMSFLRWGGSL